MDRDGTDNTRHVSFKDNFNEAESNRKYSFTRNSILDINFGILCINRLYEAVFDLQHSFENLCMSNSSSKVKVVSFFPTEIGHCIKIEIVCDEVGKHCQRISFNCNDDKPHLTISFQVMGADVGTPLLRTGIKMLSRLQSDDEDSELSS